MSVINKMLRDLDQRRSTGLDASVRAGTRVVVGLDVHSRAGRTSRAVWAVVVLGILGGVSAAAWRWWPEVKAVAVAPAPAPSLPVATTAPAPVPSSAVPAVPAVPVPVAASVQPQPPSAVQSKATLPAKVESKPESKQQEKPQVKQQAIAATDAVVKAASTSTQSAPSAPSAPAVHTAVKSQPLAGTEKANPSLEPSADVLAKRQQTAAREAIAQAQSLYAKGSGDEAVQILQEGLYAAERVNPPASSAVLLGFVRELASMELGRGRPGAVLDLLARKEALIAGQADLWAVRANAAQRLGRHSEAIQFYETALQIKPSESRWLLGTAVSLAALGQVSKASEMAERARSIAPIAKEVQAYLRQQGVVLSE